MRLRLLVIVFLAHSYIPYLSATAVGLYDYNPEENPNYKFKHPSIQGALDQFDGEVVVLYRGINFLPDNFNTLERQAMIDGSQVGQGMYSSAAYELANKTYVDTDIDMDPYGRIVSEQVSALNDGQTFRLK